MLPLFCPALALESAQNPLDALAMTFFTQKAFGRTLESHTKATFDPHQVLCLSLEMVGLNMSATSPIRLLKFYGPKKDIGLSLE